MNTDMTMQSDIRNIDTPETGNGIKIVGTVSEGHRFKVFKAMQGSRYVILKTAATHDGMSEAMLRREYEISATLSHPAVVSTLGFEENTPAGPAIVMEFINGTPLDRFMDSSPSLSARKAVLNDIIDGMEYLHRRGILHNDLKPTNIIVNGKGSARIIDFGLSEGEDIIWPNSIGGSAGFTAPEILDGKGHSGTASDIYSIGRITDFLFDGKRYRRLVRRCMKRNPAERPQNIAELRKAMRRADLMPRYVIAAAAVLALSIPVAASSLYDNISKNKTSERIGNEMYRTFSEYFPYIEKQEYKELALTFFNLYLKEFIHYSDSIMKRYPADKEGNMSFELNETSRIFNGYKGAVDSVVNGLPSLSGLPVEEQEKIYNRFNEAYNETIMDFLGITEP